jgi:hypothetical protein
MMTVQFFNGGQHLGRYRKEQHNQFYDFFLFEIKVVQTYNKTITGRIRNVFHVALWLPNK